VKIKPIRDRAGSLTALSAATVLGATMLVGHPTGAWADDDSQASKTLVAQSLETVEAGESVEIGLPNAAKAGEATALSDGAVTFPGDESANSIIVGDIGVQLLTIGRNGPQIARIAQTGTPSAILAAFGYGAFRCIIRR
jgi:hypothetical protein